jgi:hypothetical protein
MESRELTNVLILREQLNNIIRKMRTKRYSYDQKFADECTDEIVSAINCYQKHACWQDRNRIGIYADKFSNE